ncbi:ATPase, T2SS/T4P/T4SS family [Thalassoglobus sp. JC818]|uniref:ATPase, T2SS/T4P/T4SS family n=1 Tax=Thalassoglobus sp. JC818 TaxID=3232136 RepID=UPI0034589C19
MIFGFGKGGRDKDDDEDDDDDDNLDFILFRGALNGVTPDLSANGRLVQAGLIPAKKMISEALARRAEMIRIEPKPKFAGVTFFVDGIPYPAAKMPPKAANAIVQMVKLLAGLDINERSKPQSGGINAEFEEVPHEVRIDITPSASGEIMTLRAENIKNRLETPKELGFSEELQSTIRELGAKKTGLMLAVGPPMSGVTTTTVATLRGNDAYLLAIGSIADHHGRDIPHVQTFEMDEGGDLESSIRRTQRADIDILYVDPIQNQKQARTILEMSEKQAIITEMPAKDAADGIARLNTLVEQPKLVAEHLKLIVSPRLVRLLCPKCRQAYRPNPKLLERVKLPADTKVLYRAPRPDAEDADEETCENCGGIGFRGRIGLIEAIAITDDFKKLILKGASTAEFRELARKQSVQSFQSDGLRLVSEGKTSLEELQRAFRS